ncbi:MAG: hypothetical protein ACKPEY_09735, partial [Planctomycetota bacterium]
MDRADNSLSVKNSAVAANTQTKASPAAAPVGRRSFLAAAGAVAGAALAGASITTPAEARDYGPNAPPVRYPDPDIKALDKRFEKYKLGNTPIQRHHTGSLWAE